MSRQARFQCPTAPLTLKSLLRPTRWTLCVGLGFALVAHAALTRLGVISAEVKAAKPLTTQFVKRQPRLTKPLEMKKRPQPKRRQVQRTMVSVKARAATQQVGSMHAAAPLRSLARPRVVAGRSVDFSADASEPEAIAQVLEGKREAKDVVDMSLEMLDVDALDTGRYHAMVIQDPTDKRQIKGYFHFYRVYATSVLATKGRMNELPDTLINLVEKLNEWTAIQADMGQSIPFSSELIFKVPFIFFDFGGKGFEGRLTGGEARRLGQYMLRGGLYMAEDGGGGIGSTLDKAARATIEDAFAAVGKPKGRFWSFSKIPNDHAIYHCYFDFPDGPPVGADYFNKHYPQCTLKGPYPWLEGVSVEGRLLAIMSNKAYQDVWGGNPAVTGDPTRTFQMGVNIIVFALTQEGSITNRVMDSVQ